MFPIRKFFLLGKISCILGKTSAKFFLLGKRSWLVGKNLTKFSLIIKIFPNSGMYTSWKNHVFMPKLGKKFVGGNYHTCVLYLLTHQPVQCPPTLENTFKVRFQRLVNFMTFDQSEWSNHRDLWHLRHWLHYW